MTDDRLKTLISFFLDNSLLFLGGALAAALWANIDLTTHEQIAHPLHFGINDIGMVFFFALAAKEVFEATLPGGALASPYDRHRLLRDDRPRHLSCGPSGRSISAAAGHRR